MQKNQKDLFKNPRINLPSRKQANTELFTWVQGDFLYSSANQYFLKVQMHSKSYTSCIMPARTYDIQYIFGHFLHKCKNALIWPHLSL